MRVILIVAVFLSLLSAELCAQSKIVPLKIGESFDQKTWVIDTSMYFNSLTTNTALINGSVYHRIILYGATGIPTLFLKNHLQKSELNEAQIRQIEKQIKNVQKEYNIEILKVVFIDNIPLSEYASWRTTATIHPPVRSTENYKVNYYIFDNNTNSEWTKFANRIDKAMLISRSGLVIFNTASITSSKTQKAGSIKGKLLTLKENAKMPLINADVVLIDSKTSDSISRTKTDEYGDFELKLPEGKQSYILSASPASKDVQVVILASQKGVELGRFTKTAAGFTYKLILPDIEKLTEKENEDISMTFEKFGKSKNTSLSVSENILYQSDKYDLEKASLPTIDKVLLILKNNPAVKLEIVSHTDSRGSDPDNLKLSEKRANAVLEYLAAKGVERARLKAVGKGETQIRNRCTNDVSCSDKEHEYNRRTEFKFRK